MSKLFDVMVTNYPWISFFIVWLFFVCCTYLEYRINKNKNVTSGGLFFLFGFLTFAVTQIDKLGDFRWVLAMIVLMAGLSAIKNL